MIILQGLKFHVTLCTLPVVGADVVVGIPWLEQLGHVLTDFKNLTMKFSVDGDKKMLTGTTPSSPQATGINVLFKEWEIGAELFLIAEQQEDERSVDPMHKDIK